MSRRRVLKGLAHNLLAAFVSRNNDIDGYWALGKLYEFVTQAGTESIAIQLLPAPMAEPTPSITALVQRYRDMLQTMVSRVGLQGEVVRSAAIELRFRAALRPDVPQATRGDPFEAAITVMDDRGHQYSAVHFGWCDLHDPMRERRRSCATGGVR